MTADGSNFPLVRTAFIEPPRATDVLYATAYQPVLTLKREHRTTLRWHHKIPHTRIRRSGIVSERCRDESHSLPSSISAAESIRPLNGSNHKRTLASTTTRCTSITRGDSALVRHLQPVDRFNNRISRRLVCHLADQLGS
jgi:hypothetical protein